MVYKWEDLGYFRILLIPVYVLLYYHAESVREYYMAAVLVGISGITDMLDGKVARHFNMITELGKALDPVADKLTLGAMILCLAFRYENMRWLINGLIVCCGVLMAVTWVLYVPVFVKMWKENNNRLIEKD